METYSQNTRFILTCNYVEKIIKPLVSRCQVYCIEPPNKKQVAVYLKNIFDNEKIEYGLDDIKTIINDFYPDIRKIVNYSQQISSTGKVKYVKTQTVSFDVKQKLISILKEKSKSAFNDIRQLINDCGTKHFDDLYHELYDKVDIYSKTKQLDAIVIIAEYSYQNAMVVDKEITFMACVSRLINL